MRTSFFVLSGTAISYLAVFLLLGRQEAMLEMPFVIAGLAGAIGPIAILFLWNLFCAPFRIEREARKAVESELGELKSQKIDTTERAELTNLRQHADETKRRLEYLKAYSVAVSYRDKLHQKMPVIEGLIAKYAQAESEFLSEWGNPEINSERLESAPDIWSRGVWRKWEHACKIASRISREFKDLTGHDIAVNGQDALVRDPLAFSDDPKTMKLPTSLQKNARRALAMMASNKSALTRFVKVANDEGRKCDQIAQKSVPHVMCEPLELQLPLEIEEEKQH